MFVESTFIAAKPTPNFYSSVSFLNPIVEWFLVSMNHRENEKRIESIIDEMTSGRWETAIRRFLLKNVIYFFKHCPKK